MGTVATDLEAEQRRLWAEYAARLQGLEGADYDRVETEAWDALQEALAALGIARTARDDRAV